MRRLYLQTDLMQQPRLSFWMQTLLWPFLHFAANFGGHLSTRFGDAAGCRIWSTVPECGCLVVGAAMSAVERPIEAIAAINPSLAMQERWLAPAELRRATDGTVDLEGVICMVRLHSPGGC